jgi:membrane-associated phospholipid phosphatase
VRKESPPLAALVAGVVCGLGFAALAVAVATHPPPFAIDLEARETARDIQATWATAIMRTVSVLGSFPGVVTILAVVAGAILVLRREARHGLWLVVEVAGAVAMYQSLKAILDRPRPLGGLVETTGSAFPSGHATQGIAFFGLLAVVLLAVVPGRARIPAAGAAAVLGVLSGLSRVYLGVHWLTDVAGGFLLGGAWLSILMLARARARPAPPGWAGPPAGGS